MHSGLGEKSSQEGLSVGFFGPPGTFTEEAAAMISEKRVAFNSIPQVMEAVNTHKVDLGVIPIENSIEGSVGITLDLMTHDYDLKIYREIIIPISHNLLLDSQTRIEDVKIVYSHIQALSQCLKFIEDFGAITHGTPSTSAAAELIVGKKDCAAISNRRAAEIYGLKIAATDIQDYKNNHTRFVVIGHQDHSPTGKDKTSLVFFLLKDKPGGLFEILGEFAREGVNLTKIESRPSKEKLGRYVFFVDFEGHREDPQIRNILNRIRSKVGYIKILGSYPKEGD
jgi:prephenate dehydratase